MASQKADKAANAMPPPPPADGSAGAPPPPPPPIDRETDEFVVTYLKTRVKWGRILSYLEAELEGRAQELQAIQHYHRTMPKCSRPRKRARLEEGGEPGGAAAAGLVTGGAAALPPPPPAAAEQPGAPPAPGPAL